MNTERIKEIQQEQKEIGYEVGNVAWHNLNGYKELWNKADFDTKEYIVNEQGRLAIKLAISLVSNRFSPKQMAEWFHNNYEEIAKAEGWQTQDKCKVEFKDLPESNRITMIKVCERWLNDCCDLPLNLIKNNETNNF